MRLMRLILNVWHIGDKRFRKEYNYFAKYVLVERQL